MSSQLKISLGGTTKRCNWIVPPADRFLSIVSTTVRVFPELSNYNKESRSFDLTYIDEDGDQVTIDNDEMAEIFISYFNSKTRNDGQASIVVYSLAVKLRNAATPDMANIDCAAIREVGKGLTDLFATFASAGGFSDSSSTLRPSTVQYQPQCGRNDKKYAPNCKEFRRKCGGPGFSGRNFNISSAPPKVMRANNGAHIPSSTQQSTLNEPQSEPVVHAGVTCDVCQCNIVGIRYKSTMIADYDLCESCESGPAGLEHAPYIKIRSPSMCPALLLCGIDGTFGFDFAPRRWRGQCGRRFRNFRANGQPCSTFNGEVVGDTDDVQLQQAIGDSFSKMEINEVKTAAAAGEVASAAAVETVVAEEIEPKSQSETVEQPLQQYLKSPTEEGYEILDNVGANGNEKSSTEVPAGSTRDVDMLSADEEKRKRAKLWEKELTNLAAMGFVDFKKNMDLLERLMGSPGSQGMEDVLSALLDN